MENVLLCVCWLAKRKIEVLIAQLTFIMLITSHPHKRRQNIWQTFALCKLNSFPKLRFRRPRRLLYYFVLKIWPEVWWSLMKKGTDWQGKNLNINEKRFFWHFTIKLQSYCKYALQKRLQNCNILFTFFSNWDVNWSIIDRYTIYNYQRKSGGTGYDYKVDKSFEE